MITLLYMQKPLTTSEYIATAPKASQPKLRQLRAAIKKAAPKAEEYISYGMPAYRQNGMLVYFAGFKNHVGLYATPKGNEAFKKELAAYKTGKGSIQFPLSEPLPLALITKIVKFKIKENSQSIKRK
jgi:uncharacterized protein YdhG (YjbR/CyaY superfamily)